MIIFGKMSASKVNLSLIILLAGTILPLRTIVAESKGEEEQGNYRLPQNVTPLHYDIQLVVYMTENNFTFDGVILINLEILSTRHNIILHKNELEVDEDYTKLMHASDTEIPVYLPTNHSYNNETETVTLHFEENLHPDLYTLVMKFTGDLYNTMTGFYRSPYIDEDGTLRWIATTNFEPTHARRAFPCFDEPALKATFNISIQHDNDYIALSNMPVLRRDPVDEKGDRVWTEFEITPKMSTYLVAFVVGDLVNISSPDGMTNVWTTRDVIGKASYVLEVATAATHALEEYTNSSFRMPKMDHVGVSRFPSAAMENWGLIIYREKSLLYDTTLPTSKKIAVAQTAVHELAHQWFGNVVSPCWWSYVWLNEAFAVYFEVYIFDQITDLNWMDYFVVTNQHSILQTDSTGNTKPVTVDVKTASDAMSAFSSIIYIKGASVLRMLSHVLTEDIFRDGLIKYINTYQYKAASSSDLWRSLQSVLDESNIAPNEFRVAEAMNTWMDQRGYPQVTVHRNYENGTATLAQTIFRPQFCLEDIGRTEKKNEETKDTANVIEEDSKWWIPISYTTQSHVNFLDTKPKVWMKPQEDITTIEGIAENDWIIVNLQEAGFYRVNYDTANWHKIAKYLNSDNYSNIHPLNRAQILDDGFTFLRTCQLDPLLYIELMSYLSREGDIIPWIPVFRVFQFFELYIEELTTNNVFMPHLSNLFNSLTESIGFEERPDDNDMIKTQRRHVIKWACKFGNTECRRKTVERTFAYLADPHLNNIPRDLKEYVICEGLRTANESVWIQLFNTIFTVEKDQRRIMFSIVTCVRNDLIIKWHIDTISAKDSMLYEKFLLRLLALALSKNVEATDVILDHVIEHCNETETIKNEKYTQLAITHYIYLCDFFFLFSGIIPFNACSSILVELVTKVISKNLYKMEQVNKARTMVRTCGIVYDEDELKKAEAKVNKIEREVSILKSNIEEISRERSSSE